MMARILLYRTLLNDTDFDWGNDFALGQFRERCLGTGVRLGGSDCYHTQVPGGTLPQWAYRWRTVASTNL